MKSSDNQARQDRVMAQLRSYLRPESIAALDQASARMDVVLAGCGHVDPIVLAMFGGGKDSSFMVAAVRYAQLRLKEQTGKTFRLRVATNRHSGMPQAVMQNIDRVYRALALQDDAEAQLLLIDGNRLSAFDPDCPVPEDLRSRDRVNIVMNGHRCQGDPRPTFCNSCNISMENGVALALRHEKAAHVIVTGDSPAEQRFYAAWVRHASRKLRVEPKPGPPGLRRFLEDLSGIAHELHADVFRGLPDEIAAREISVTGIRQEPVFFSIYEDAEYSVGDHWELITEFLGFEFDEIAFSFTESDCGNPGLMAHLHGLRHERLLHQSYSAGVLEYVNYATQLMRRKTFPEHLVQTMAARYVDSQAVRRMREKMNWYAGQAFQLTEEHLVCMIYSPFTEGAKNLGLYLIQEQPALAASESKIRQLLAGELQPAEAPLLDEALFSLSALQHHYRRALFESPLIETRTVGALANTPISIILKRDPHKALVERVAENGQSIREQISGR